MERTRAALNEFSAALDQEQIALDQMAEELEANAITMSDGRKVYFDSETGRYVCQGEDGQWQELENEEDIAEAMARHEGQGKVSTRQDKDKHTRLQQEHDSARWFIVSANDQLDRIEEQVANGDISPAEGERQRQKVEEDLNESRDGYDQRQEQIRLSPQSLEDRAAKQVADKVAQEERHEAMGSKLDENELGIPALPPGGPTAYS
jgi:FtsZ-interacting cell division protein ZipA